LTVPVLVRAARGLTRSFEDGAVIGVHPPVIAAADAMVGDDAELERSTAMRAMLMKQSDVPGEIPIDDQIFAENPNGARTATQLGREQDGMPEPPQVFSARSAVPHPRGQLL